MAPTTDDPSSRAWLLGLRAADRASLQPRLTSLRSELCRDRDHVIDERSLVGLSVCTDLEIRTDQRTT